MYVYRIYLNRYYKTFTDIDECAKVNCTVGRCVNTIGSYKCYTKSFFSNFVGNSMAGHAASSVSLASLTTACIISTIVAVLVSLLLLSFIKKVVNNYHNNLYLNFDFVILIYYNLFMDYIYCIF